MNSYPTSDCKQCTESKLGWVHSAHTQSPGRAHTACAVPRSWALLRAQRPCRAHSKRMPRAQREQAARSACAGRAHSSHVVGPCCDLPALPSPTVQVGTSLRCRDIKAARIMSRHHIGVATPSLLPASSQVATLCRDINFMSRPPRRPTFVSTSLPCRDILKTNLCRDIVFMSRPPRLMSMSRHQIHVATSSPA